MSNRINIPINFERITALCRKWKINELSLFGSVLREDFRPDSDVDVLVTFAPDAPWSLWEIVALREELMAEFGRTVDIVERAAIRNPYRRANILQDHRVLYAA